MDHRLKAQSRLGTDGTRPGLLEEGGTYNKCFTFTEERPYKQHSQAEPPNNLWPA